MTDFLVDTASDETRAKYMGGPLWKPWMEKFRLRQIGSLESLDEYLEAAESHPMISWDLETTSLDPRPHTVCGHCLAYRPDEAVYIPVRHQNTDMNLDPDSVWSRIWGVVNRKRLAVYNLKFEGRYLRYLGLRRSTRINVTCDVLLYRWLWDSDALKADLKSSAKEILGYEMLDIQEVPEVQYKVDRKKRIDFSRSNPGDATLYAAADPLMTLQLWLVLHEQIEREQPLILEMEHRLIEMLLDMEDRGVQIDMNFVRHADVSLTRWIAVTQQEVFREAGKVFNPASPIELYDVLCEKGMADRIPKTEKGNNQMDEAVLESLKADCPLAATIVRLRGIEKQRSTYVEPFIHYFDERPGIPVAHFQLKQHGAATGRFTSSGEKGDPFYVGVNAQNIPQANAYEDAACRLVHNPPEELMTIASGV